MNIKMENFIQKKVDRWKDVYESKRHFLIMLFFTDDNNPPMPPLYMNKKIERIEWAKRHYDYCLSPVRQKIDDDYIPNLSVFTGSEVFGECFGCEVNYPENHAPHTLHFVGNPKEAAKIKKPKLEDTSLIQLLDMAEKLKQYSGKDALLRLPDIQDPMSVVAQIWDKSDLFVSMIESPDAVKELAAKVVELQTEFLDEWYKRFGKEHIACFPECYMESGLAMPVDEIGSVNSSMFDEFFLSNYNFLSDRYGGFALHCCAFAEHQWGGLAKIRNLKFINLYAAPEIIDKAYAYFADKAVQCHGVLENGVTDNLLPKHPEEYPADSRVIIYKNCEDYNDAIRVYEEFLKIYR